MRRSKRSTNRRCTSGRRKHGGAGASLGDGHQPCRRLGRGPKTSPSCEKDQYNFTDPDSRIMKNSTNQGFDQHYNVQVAVTQETLLIVGESLSNHPNDQAEAKPTVESIPPKLGQPEAAPWTTASTARPTSRCSRGGGLSRIKGDDKFLRQFLRATERSKNTRNAAWGNVNVVKKTNCFLKSKK